MKIRTSRSKEKCTSECEEGKGREGNGGAARRFITEVVASLGVT